ncbi:uncharacterized protein LOC127659023 isoform X3 [Xyrauchen texanus]|uniref:uncharacterized protein LOC127659023 isoform X3 n=1 Tax=Xyrauchen texanus TaxID=154827 RepID=UPI002242BFC1|nr:uncharacterized protein LOC127659023 isoform X3 [Xyrauchen texanus]
MDVNLTISLMRGQMGAVIEKAVNAAVETVLGEMIRVVGLKFEEIKHEMTAKEKENENIRKILETHRCQMKTMRKYISVLAAKDPNSHRIPEGDEEMALHCRGPTSTISMCAKSPNPCPRPRVKEPAPVAGPSWARQQMHTFKAQNIGQEPLRTEHQLADLHIEEIQGSSVHKVDNSSRHLVDNQGLLCETSDPIWGQNPLIPAVAVPTEMPDTSVLSAPMMTFDPTQTTTTQTVDFGEASLKIKQEEAEVEIVCIKDEDSEAASTSRFDYSNPELHQPLVVPEFGGSLDLPGSFQALQSSGTSAELAIPAYINVDPTSYTVMAKTAAERQREYRARRNADPVRREKYLRSERERWKRDIDTGKKKRIGDLGEKDQRWRRKKWRDAKERQKKSEPIFKIIASPTNNPESSLMVWLQP